MAGIDSVVLEDLSPVGPVLLLDIVPVTTVVLKYSSFATGSQGTFPNTEVLGRGTTEWAGEVRIEGLNGFFYSERIVAVTVGDVTTIPGPRAGLPPTVGVIEDVTEGPAGGFYVLPSG